MKSPKATTGMVLTEAELVEQVRTDRASGYTISFANGCFDVLHVGHVRYLTGAATEADRLIVAVNDDASVVTLKGPGRPIQRAVDRAALIAALRMVDFVVVFSDLTVERLLTMIQPEVHCKGSDYTVETVPERGIVKAYGGRTVIVGENKNHSTRDLIARIRASESR
jgi:rfaE bifunctional protein nucleotidyltransferase chain/domain